MEPLHVEEMLVELALSGDESDDVACPKCGLLYSTDKDNLWDCCDKCSSWYDFKCRKLRSKKRIPATYVCDLCKKNSVTHN